MGRKKTSFLSMLLIIVLSFGGGYLLCYFNEYGTLSRQQLGTLDQAANIIEN